jgi:hypothetical protein
MKVFDSSERVRLTPLRDRHPRAGLALGQAFAIPAIFLCRYRKLG